MAVGKRTVRRSSGRIIIVLLVAGIGMYGALKFGQGLWRVWRLSSMLKTEERSLNEALDRIETLEAEIERLSNDLKYIEKLAREEYGMVKDGEDVYRVTGTDDSK